MFIRLLLSSIFLFFSIFFSGCQKKEELNATKEGIPVTMQKPTRGDVVETERSMGTIDAKSAPVINAEVNGQVVKVLCEVGDSVKAGQILATIDGSQYQNSKDASSAQVSSLRSQLENQKKTVARYEELLKQNFISEAKLDDLKTQQKSLEEQLSSAKAQLGESDRLVSKSVVRSPINGFVYSRSVSVGDFATVGKPLFAVVNAANLTIKAPFPQSVAGVVKKGQKALLFVNENQKLEGTISDIKPFVLSTGRSFDAVIEVKNPGNWLAGASVSVEVATNERKNAILLPESAVVLRPVGTVVYLMEGDTAKQKKVVVGQKQNGSIEIKEGLGGNESVIVEGAGLLSDGAKVSLSKVAK